MPFISYSEYINVFPALLLFAADSAFLPAIAVDDHVEGAGWILFIDPMPAGGDRMKKGMKPTICPLRPYATGAVSAAHRGGPQNSIDWHGLPFVIVPPHHVRLDETTIPAGLSYRLHEVILP